MSKNAVLFLIICLVAILPRTGLAQGYHDPQNEEEMGKPYGKGTHTTVEVPPGMELINVGGIRMVIPQGTKVEKKGSLLVMESADEFAARNFKEMREHLERTESAQDNLRKTIEDLKLEISDLRKK
ncbi:MAG: hypothetical protein V1882_12750 [Candidatus Omnitrophota bacterium]